MAIRDVGGDKFTVCDFQNDLKTGQSPAEEQAAPAEQQQAEVVQAAVASTLPNQTLRARKTMGSSNLKAALASKLNSPASSAAVGREFQTAVNNILRSATRLSEGTARFRSMAEGQLSGIKNDASQFIDGASESSGRLEQGQSALAAQPQLNDVVGNLIKQIQGVIGTVKSMTNDLLYNSNLNLNSLTKNATKYQESAQQMAQGNAAAIKTAANALGKVGVLPNKVSTQAAEYAQAMDKQVTPLATQAKAAATSLSATSNVDSFSLKDVAHNLADKAYKFVYNVKEKAGNIIDEYVNPILKAVGTGFSNLWSSIFNPDRNPNGKPIEVNKLVSNTQDLRDTIKAAQTGNAAAQEKLLQKYGYTLDTLPKPGSMYLAANYVAGDLKNGLVTSQKFPGTQVPSIKTGGLAPKQKPIDSNPPDLGQFLFGEGKPGLTGAMPTTSKPIVIKDTNGKEVTVKSMTEYQKVVAANREKLGIPANGGKAIPVHLSLEGGGGKGKRYASAFEEMYNLGVVPASVSGVSVGAIAGALVAAGLPPQNADDIAKDPRAKKFFDATIAGPGILEGRELYRYMDEKLRELTGIKDRPVTFADLQIPLYLGTTKLADNQATNDMSRVEDRLFIFSKETTPNTPVAMAVVASAAIPGAFDPIEMVDPITGRNIRLADGGVVDTLPINYQKMLNPNNKLPELAIQLNEPNQNYPKDPANNSTTQPLPKGNLNSNNPFGYAQIGLDVQAKSADNGNSYRERNNPKPGVFVLNVPTWNLQDFSKQDSTFEFEYNNGVDPALDTQTAAITRGFFQSFLTKLEDPKASGTNLKPFPPSTNFTRTFNANGATWTATYTGGDEVTFRSNTGKTHHVNLGKERLETWISDDKSFGDLAFRMRDVLVDHEKFLKTFGIN
jgi:NTE family protein